jgi:TRAP-type uncharacterized transport system fused permease subunit
MTSHKRVTTTQYLLDKTGIWMSAICAVHCLVLPMFLSVSIFSGLAFMQDERIENAVLVMSAIVGAASLFPASIRHHKKLTPVIVLLCGFVMISLGKFLFTEYETVLTSSGAIIVAVSHYVNFKLCRKWHARD